MKTTLYACLSFFIGCVSVGAAISGVALLTGHPLSENGAAWTMALSLLSGYFALTIYADER